MPLPYFVQRIGMEPPFRILSRALLGRLKVSVQTRALWDLSKRPAYLLGLVAAAEQAQRQKVPEIGVIEFGVAGGRGLVIMQQDAAAVERETGVGIRVYGFDMGPSGLPDFSGDHRDHPDIWQPGDYPMEVDELRARLTERTNLVLGNLRDTVPVFGQQYRPPPIGFVSVDVDLYSSSCDALRVFSATGVTSLWHVPMYFDDIDFMFNHRYGGELLAIDEFNRQQERFKIDRWYGVRSARPFPERGYLDKMYVAHDLQATSSSRLDRPRGHLPLSASSR
ncbi:MAG: hypothetical protein IT499_23390 [Rubrivivax sp.]|nr:hypothetical protein [Rubrivivax sp.]